MVEGLLHIGGMAVLAGVAYLGLDKLEIKEDEIRDQGREAVKALKKQENDTTNALKEELARFDFRPADLAANESVALHDSVNSFRGRFILELAGVKYKSKKLDAGYKAFKWLFHLGIAYFSHAIDRIVVSILSLLCFISFFLFN